MKLKDLVGEGKYTEWKNKVTSINQRVPTAWTIDKVGKIKKYNVGLIMDISVGYEISGETVFAIGSGSGKTEAPDIAIKPLETDKLLNRLARATEISLDTANIIDKEDNIVLIFGQIPNNVIVRNLEKTDSTSMTAYTSDGTYSLVFNNDKLQSITGFKIDVPEDLKEILNGAEVAVIGRPRVSKKNDKEFKNLNVYGIYKLS